MPQNENRKANCNCRKKFAWLVILPIGARAHKPVRTRARRKSLCPINLYANLYFYRHMRNVVIIGSGCAGNTAAIYTARANLKPLVISGHEAGGQLSLTTLVENFPGFPEGINGPDLVENMKKQAEHFGAEYLHGARHRRRSLDAPVPPQRGRRVDRDAHA